MILAKIAAKFVPKTAAFLIPMAFLFSAASQASTSYQPAVGDKAVVKVTVEGPRGGLVGIQTREIISYNFVDKLWSVKESWTQVDQPRSSVSLMTTENLGYFAGAEYDQCGGVDWHGQSKLITVAAGTLKVCEFLDVTRPCYIDLGLVPFGVVNRICNVPWELGARIWELQSFEKH